MKILVTAFGPFAGRPENASSLALSELKKRLPNLRTRILPVDSVIAPARLMQAILQIKPDVLIMLGEAAGSTTIRLETTAWNELDFTIPDIVGRQPRSRKIVPEAPDRFSSTLPLERIRDALVSIGHEISLSNDPGRYLCNQIFYRALHYLSGATSCPAGFIHLPLAQDLPTSTAVDALEHVIDLTT